LEAVQGPHQVAEKQTREWGWAVMKVRREVGLSMEWSMVLSEGSSRFDCVEPRCLLATSDIPLLLLLIISLGVKKEVK
jgi:hypothetical protein